MRRSAEIRLRRRPWLAAAALATLLTSPAAGQEPADPLRSLRPGIEGEARRGPPPAAERPAEAAPGLPAELAPDPLAAAPPAPPPSAAEADRERPLRLGVLAGRDVRATMAATEPLAAALRQELGRPVEILPMSSYAAMIDAQATQRIDGGFYSAAAYAAAEAACRCLEPLVAAAAADGTTAYYSIVVAPEGSGIASPADLEGKTVALGPADSLAGRRMALAGLMAEGFDPQQFGAVRESASAEEAVRLVLAGGADAAVAWSSLSGDADRGYSRGTLADLAARGDAAVGDLAVVWRSPPVAHGPFAVLKSMPARDKERIEAYLVGLHQAAPGVYDKLAPYYGGGFRPVEPADYSGLAVLTAHDVDALSWPSPPAPPAAR